MIRTSLSSTTVGAATAPRSVANASSKTQLSQAEQRSIANAFPERPVVSQRLYGARREVRTHGDLGARFDLSA